MLRSFWQKYRMRRPFRPGAANGYLRLAAEHEYPNRIFGKNCNSRYIQVEFTTVCHATTPLAPQHMPHSVPAPTALAEPALIIPYDECLQYVQLQLSSFIHGDLKPWTEEQQLNYSMIVNLKNGRLTGPVPRLIQKIMAVFGFTLAARRVKRDDGFVVEFSLRDASQIAAFRAQTV